MFVPLAGGVDVHVGAHLMAGAGAVALVWNVKLPRCSPLPRRPIGASFTALALLTGSPLGQADVGRLVGVGRSSHFSELILLFSISA